MTVKQQKNSRKSLKSKSENKHMQLYDGLIQDWERLIGESSCPSGMAAEAATAAWQSQENQLILKQEAAVELGGGTNPALSMILFTESRKYTGGCKIEHYGSDLCALSGNVPYARVVVAGIREEFLSEDFKWYALFRSVEYIRYHVNPYGYMPRISAVGSREQIRVSKDAIKQGISFYKVGGVYEKAYLAHPAVKWIKQYFITMENFSYEKAGILAAEAEKITMSLEHPLNTLQMDCNSCNLKAVCEEVENITMKFNSNLK